jgi:glycerol kinase
MIWQIQADLINIPVKRPAMRETTALGAAIAAGLASGVWKSIDELKDVNTHGSTQFRPAIKEEEGQARFARWQKAVEMSKGWAN